jgi:hypothetical protein
MKKILLIAITAVAPLIAADQTFTGIITDSMCPAGDHSDMKSKSDAQCVVECMKGMKGMKYALYDGKNTYILSDQQKPEKFAAKKVTVTGTLDAKTKTIRVTTIAPAK